MITAPAQNITNITKHEAKTAADAVPCPALAGADGQSTKCYCYYWSTDKGYLKASTFNTTANTTAPGGVCVLIYLLFPPWSVKVSKNIKFPSGNDEIKVTWHLIAWTGRERLAKIDIASCYLLYRGVTQVQVGIWRQIISPPHYVTDIERVFSVSIVLNSLVFKCFYRQTDIVLSIPLSLQKWHYQYQAGLGHETVSTRQKYHIIKTGGGCIIGQHMPALHPYMETCHTRMCLGRNSEIINVILPLSFYLASHLWECLSGECLYWSFYVYWCRDHPG